MRDGIVVNGIILSVMPVGEADRRLLLLTKELGKISAFARGARRPTSPMVGLARPFLFGVFTLVQGRSAYSVQKAEISEYFEDLSADVAKSAYGCAFAELSAYFGRENADETASLSLLYYAFKALGKEKIPQELVRTAFELKLLAQNGLMPEFRNCPKCGKTLESGCFSPALMQALCTDCAGEEQLYPLCKSSIYTLEYIRTAPVNRLFTFTVTEQVLSELSEVTEILLQRSIDRSLPARDMLRVLVRPD